MNMPQKSRAWSWDGLKLFFMGYLTLFLELALIRYLAGNIWNLGYFPNLVLIAVFIGMGVGFTLHHLFSPRTSRVLVHCASPVLLGLVIFVYFKHPTVPGFNAWEGNLGGDLYFTATPDSSVQQTYAAFVVCMLAVIIVFALMSQRTAKLFRRFQPLTAYTLDIAGSCAGIATFMVLSFLTVPAAVWFAIFAVALLVPVGGSWRLRWLPLLPGAALALLISKQDQRLVADPQYQGPVESYWSPYQKVEYVNLPGNPRRIFVNGVSHQHMEHPDTLPRSFYQPIYNSRTEDASVGPYRNVLILGAGSGSDVTAALMNGAAHVDAVEIDPVIARLGLAHNPYRAYQSPKVNLVIDDGRAFLTRTDRRYDLIVFALTDSIVKVSSMSQLRLENYLFTEESVRRAWRVLKEGGDLVFYNFYRQPWLREKIEELIHKASGIYPRPIYQRSDFVVLATRKLAGSAPEELRSPIQTPTDDWPFLYLRRRGIPTVYRYAMVGMLLFVSLYVVILQLATRKKEQLATPGLLPLKLAFVFMGIAFLLLETKSVIQFSLLFGTTWLNNSLVFLAVLLFVLAANWLATLIRDLRWIWMIYGLLVVSSLSTFFYPLGNLLGFESPFVRFLLASLLTFSPIFFANLIFSLAFRDQLVAEHLFGWNLIGATLGGVSEYASMAFGYRVLAVMVAVCYTLVLALLIAWQRANDTARAPS
jgi:SAM-dependent methyltransferase